MRNINQILIIIFMFFFFIQVNKSNAIVSILGALYHPLLAQVAGMLYHGGFGAACGKSKDDNRTFAKKAVDVTARAAAYSATFAGFHYVKAGLEAAGVDERRANGGAVFLGVIIGATISTISNKLGDLSIKCCGCALTKGRQTTDEEIRLR